MFLFRGGGTILQSLAPAEMEEHEEELDRKSHNCSICLDLLKDPGDYCLWTQLLYELY